MSCPVAVNMRGDRRGRRKRHGLHPGGDGAVRPDEGELGQVVERGLEDAADSLIGKGGLGDDRLPVAAALEVARRRLLVPAHVPLEYCPGRPDRRSLEHEALIERVGVARDHVHAASVAGRVRVHDVAHGADDVRLDLAELGVLGEVGDWLRSQPGLHLLQLTLDPARKLDRLGDVLEEEGGSAGDAVPEHVGAKATGLADCAGAAVKGDRRGRPRCWRAGRTRPRGRDRARRAGQRARRACSRRARRRSGRRRRRGRARHR